MIKTIKTEIYISGKYSIGIMTPTRRDFVKNLVKEKKVTLQKDQLILKKKHVFLQNFLDKNQKIHSKLLNNKKDQQVEINTKYLALLTLPLM